MTVRRGAARGLAVGALGVSLLMGGGHGGLAHPEGCQAALVAAPIEHLELPLGWILSAVEVDAAGWAGRAEWSGGDFRVATFTLACTEEPTALLGRRASLRSMTGVAELPVELAIGEERIAYDRYREDGIRLEWAAGDVFGTVVGGGNASLAELERIAAGLLGRLSAEPASPGS